MHWLKLYFRNAQGIMNTSGLLQRSTLQETRSIHDSMDRLKIEFIAYIYILLSKIEKLFITKGKNRFVFNM